MPDKKFVPVAQGRTTLDIELSDGSQWSIPLLSSLNVRKAREFAKKLRGADDENIDVFVDFLDENCPGLTDALTMGVLNEIVKLWNQAEIDRGQSMGE